jgi:FkbM family methyltransferase
MTWEASRLAYWLHRSAASVADRLGDRDASWRRTFSPWFSRVLQAASGGRGLRIELNGEPFYIDARHRTFLQPDYEARVAAFLRAHVGPAALCLDVGAHIGAYAMQMARWVGPRGRVVAFEAHPGTAEILRRHVAMNDLGAVVQVEQTAVGSVEGSVRLFGGAGSGLSRVGGPPPGASLPPPLDVPVTTIDRYCTGRGLSPDWMLVDVEGQEFAVLEGARGTLASCGPALSVIVEMHPSAWEGAGWSRERGQALLVSLGRQAVALTGQADPFTDYGAVSLEPLPPREPAER